MSSPGTKKRQLASLNETEYYPLNVNVCVINLSERQLRASHNIKNRFAGKIDIASLSSSGGEIWRLKDTGESSLLPQCAPASEKV